MFPTFRPFKDAFKLLVSPLMLRVRGGPLDGLRFSVAAGTRFVTGTFEPYKTRALTDHIKPGQTVVDVGAHVGYYSALASRLVGPAGRVVAFEPRPVNIALFRRHMTGNGIANVTLVEAAVGDRNGKVRFEARTGTGTGHVAEGGNLEVPMVRLDDLVDQGRVPPPSFLKVDVEGGEGAVLHGARRTIDTHRPVLLVATHGPALHSGVLAFLDARGYHHEVLDPGVAHGDLEVLALP